MIQILFFLVFVALIIIYGRKRRSSTLTESPLKINQNLRTWLLFTTVLFSSLTLLLTLFTILVYTLGVPGAVPSAYGNAPKLGVNLNNLRFEQILVLTSVLSFPIFSIIGIYFGWSNAKKAPKISIIYSCLPFLSILLFIIWWIMP